MRRAALAASLLLCGAALKTCDTAEDMKHTASIAFADSAKTCGATNVPDGALFNENGELVMGAKLDNAKNVEEFRLCVVRETRKALTDETCAVQNIKLARVNDLGDIAITGKLGGRCIPLGTHLINVLTGESK